MLTQEHKSTQLNKTLTVLLAELGEECSNILTLLSQLQLANLSIDQKGDILAQLSSAVAHVHVHTEDLPDLIGDELFQLPDPE
ncbi:MAG: hypothetical protein GC158_01715 [Cyanobacteria bacterium RI_101]|nr:hypothetical protein [Cyanobacteria bacterium RI_101]